MAARCLIPGCDWETPVKNRHISGCLATWHVYEEHPRIWLEQFGDRPPRDPDPRTDKGMLEAILEDEFGAII